MEGYAAVDRRLDALVEAMKLVFDEFEKTRELEIAAAGHVLSGLIVRHMQELEHELDVLLEEAQL